MSTSEPPDSAEIVFEEVTRRFGGGAGAVLAVDGVSGRIPGGSFVSIVGPSGCGKSTLLNLIAGLDTLSSGRVLVGGAELTGGDQGIGMVFQEDSTLPWRTTLENVAFGLELRGVNRSERIGRARQMIELVGLSGFERAYPAALSGGMRQRVCIARTLALEPRVLLMDEPFGALDQQTRLILGGELRRIWRESGATVVFVTHDIDEAVMLSEEVWVMSYRPGRLIDKVAIDLPDDRGFDIVVTEPFGQLVRRIWSSVQAEAQRGFAADQQDRLRVDG